MSKMSGRLWTHGQEMTIMTSLSSLVKIKWHWGLMICKNTSPKVSYEFGQSLAAIITELSCVVKVRIHFSTIYLGLGILVFTLYSKQ